MKKRTKIASLFLAMLMAFSCMAMTASAYGEEIEPRGPVGPQGPPCRSCGYTTVLQYDEDTHKSWYECMDCHLIQ